MNRKVTLCTIVALATLVGCAATVPMVKIEPVIESKPLILNKAESKSIYLPEITSILKDAKIGQMKAGSWCIGGEDLIWQNNVGVMNTMTTKIKDVFSQNGYLVSSSLLKEKAMNDSEVLVGSAISNIKANICSAILDGYKGEVLVEMTWEVYDKLSKQTLNLTTKGSHKIAKFSATGDPDLFVKSVEVATNNLLSSPKLHALLSK